MGQLACVGALRLGRSLFISLAQGALGAVQQRALNQAHGAQREGIRELCFATGQASMWLISWLMWLECWSDD